MASFNVSIIEGDGGYVSSGYESSGYVTAGTSAIDSITGQLGANRSVSQTVTLTDAINNLDIGRAIAETITNSGVVARLCAFTRFITQGTGGYTSTGYTVSGYVTDNLVLLTDAVARIRDVPVSLSQTITTSDTVAKIAAFSRSVSEAITHSDTLARLYAGLRTITPTVTTTDNVARSATFSRAIAESPFISEILVAIKGIPGVGVTRIRETTAFVLKRSGIAKVFKRSTTTSS